MLKVLLITILSAFTSFKKPNLVKYSPTPIPTQIISPIPKKNISLPDYSKIGPCVTVPVLMYHHIQPEAMAKSKNQQNLTVTPDNFKNQLLYLKSHGYTAIFPSAISHFFDNNIVLPKKSVVITIDDGYEDNYIYAFPIIQELNMPVTIFTATGLVTVSDYLNWSQIKTMVDSGLVYFANHTWSHQSSYASSAKLDMEISTADSQLSERNLNTDKIFAYPYGKSTQTAENILNKYNYKLAFTTTHGTVACKGTRFDIPRIRVGNASLSNFGL